MKDLIRLTIGCGLIGYLHILTTNPVYGQTLPTDTHPVISAPKSSFLVAQVNSGFVSSSSSASSFVNSTGAGASSSAIVISPAGTIIRNDSVFTPGATSSSAGATAAAATNGPNFATTTVTAPATTVNMSVPSVATVNTSNPAIVGIGSNAVSSSLTGISVSNVNLPVVSPQATFIPVFQSPLPTSNITRPTPAGAAASSKIVVKGLPSRVFPGLGLYYDFE